MVSFDDVALRATSLVRERLCRSPVEAWEVAARELFPHARFRGVVVQLVVSATPAQPSGDPASAPIAGLPIAEEGPRHQGLAASAAGGRREGAYRTGDRVGAGRASSRTSRHRRVRGRPPPMGRRWSGRQRAPPDWQARCDVAARTVARTRAARIADLGTNASFGRTPDSSRPVRVAPANTPNWPSPLRSGWRRLPTGSVKERYTRWHVFWSGVVQSLGSVCSQGGALGKRQ